MNEKALRIFSKEIAQAVTGMTAGVINYMGEADCFSFNSFVFVSNSKELHKNRG